MIERVRLIDRLKRDVHAQTLEHALVDGGQNDGRMHLAAAKRGQRLHGQLRRRIRDGADGQRDQHLVGVQAGVGVAEMLDLQMLDRCEDHGGDEIYAVVDPGGELDGVEQGGAGRTHEPGGLAGDDPAVRQLDGGGWVDIAAPGGSAYYSSGQIYSTVPGNKYGWMQGTSMACPHVSGVAALIVSQYGGPGFTNDMLKERLINGANKIALSSNTKIGPLVDAYGSIVLAIVFIAKDLGLNFSGVVQTVRESSYSKMFFFDDVNHPEYFWKQFLAGVFTVIAMTGLDQDMMQRTLSSRNAKDSQKNLITSGLLQIPVIFLFLCLGVLLYIFAGQKGISEVGDTLFPAVATGGYLPAIVGVLFVIGLVSCAFAAGGSALTALTTSFTVDIIGTKGKSEEQVTTIRKKVHLLMAFLMGVVIFVFYLLNTKSAIDAVYKLASYTYGPILGMFAFGIFSKKKVNDKWVPLVAVIAPVLCFILQSNSERWFGGYKFSYELLLFNALFTILGLCLLIRRKKSN